MCEEPGPGPVPVSTSLRAGSPRGGVWLRSPERTSRPGNAGRLLVRGSGPALGHVLSPLRGGRRGRTSSMRNPGSERLSHAQLHPGNTGPGPHLLGLSPKPMTTKQRAAGVGDTDGSQQGQSGFHSRIRAGNLPRSSRHGQHPVCQCSAGHPGGAVGVGVEWSGLRLTCQPHH